MSKKLKTFELNYYGKKYKLALVKKGKYRDGSIAISCFDTKTKEPFADVTECIMRSRKFKENEGFVKCYGENSFMLNFILDNKIGEIVKDENGNKIWENEGYCEFPLIAFDLEKINIITED